jgi:transcriptional regulator with XRE-family HTH domain
MLCHMEAVQRDPRPANLGQGWTVDDGTFGARLALIRQRMQWNIKEAARECGIPAASWGTWENGAMPRRYTEMCRLIAERTGCDYGWLLAGPRLKATNPTLDLDAIANAIGIDPADLRSRVEGRSGRDFDLASAESTATIGHLSVGLPVRVNRTPRRRRTPRPFSQPKPGPTRPVSAVPARQRRPQPVRPGDRPVRR